MPTKTWDDYAQQLDGKTFVTDDGIEVTLKWTPTTYTSTTLHGEPTEKGKTTKKYQDEKHRLGDDWCYCWQGELPDRVWQLLDN